MLFQPRFIVNAANGVPDTTFRLILECEVDIRMERYANVVLSGDTAMFAAAITAEREIVRDRIDQGSNREH